MKWLNFYLQLYATNILILVNRSISMCTHTVLNLLTCTEMYLSPYTRSNDDDLE